MYTLGWGKYIGTCACLTPQSSKTPLKPECLWHFWLPCCQRNTSKLETQPEKINNIFGMLDAGQLLFATCMCVWVQVGSYDTFSPHKYTSEKILGIIFQTFFLDHLGLSSHSSVEVVKWKKMAAKYEPLSFRGYIMI